MGARIRFAEPKDAAAIQAIYAPNVESTAISFELRAPTVEEMAARIAKISPQYPWLVCEIDGVVAGYVYACQHRERAAYRWAVDVTVYVNAAFRRRGVGRALYTSLIALVRQQGYTRAYAGITLPNAGSVGMHESVGFVPLAVYKKVGYKLGEWRDVGWWELELQDGAGEPAEPTPMLDLCSTPATLAALTSGEKLLRSIVVAACPQLPVGERHRDFATGVKILPTGYEHRGFPDANGLHLAIRASHGPRPRDSNAGGRFYRRLAKMAKQCSESDAVPPERRDILAQKLTWVALPEKFPAESWSGQLSSACAAGNVDTD